jgi:hypothetical protein
VEGQSKHLDLEVDGVAGQIAFGPAPIAIFYDESGIGGQNKIARPAFDQLESALLQQRHQWDQPCGADLFARPAWSLPDVMITRGCHSLFSSGVG